MCRKGKTNVTETYSFYLPELPSGANIGGTSAYGKKNY
jgi:hypothetical protein